MALPYAWHPDHFEATLATRTRVERAVDEWIRHRIETGEITGEPTEELGPRVDTIEEFRERLAARRSERVAEETP
jgi:hypothetical protein